MEEYAYHTFYCVGIDIEHILDDREYWGWEMVKITPLDDREFEDRMYEIEFRKKKIDLDPELLNDDNIYFKYE